MEYIYKYTYTVIRRPMAIVILASRIDPAARLDLWFAIRRVGWHHGATYGRWFIAVSGHVTGSAVHLDFETFFVFDFRLGLTEWRNVQIYPFTQATGCLKLSIRWLTIRRRLLSPCLVRSRGKMKSGSTLMWEIIWLSGIPMAADDPHSPAFSTKLVWCMPFCGVGQAC